MMAILDFLDFEQLFNAADCGYRIRSIIQNHYAIPKYQIHRKTIYVGDYKFGEVPLVFQENAIHLHDLYTTLRFIRVFGPVITKLSISNNLHSGESNQIAEYLNKYATNSLNSLKISVSSENMISKWRNVFRNLIKLNLSVGFHVRDITICHLYELFPNIETLQMAWSANMPPVCLSQYFRRLRHLHFVDINSHSDKNIRELLAVNNNLRSLYMENECDTNFLRFLSQMEPHLKELTITNLKWNFFSHTAHNDVIHLTHLKKLNIEMINGGLKRIEHFPFHFECLEEFELVEQNISNRWVDFIIQQNCLKKLRIASDAWTTDNWHQISTKLPKLAELSVFYRYRNSDGIFHLIEHNSSLRKIAFQIQFASQREHVRNLMSAQWKVISENNPHPYDIVYVRVN